MNSGLRRVEDCPQLTTSHAGKRICRAADRLVGLALDSLVKATEVHLADCLACCNFPKPGAGTTNPVLAALVYRMAHASLSDPTIPVMDRIRCREAIQFVLPLLHQGDVRSNDPTAMERRCTVDTLSARHTSERQEYQDRRPRIGLTGINSARRET